MDPLINYRVGRNGPARRRWLALAAVLLATFMDLIDLTIVNVALPRIQRELGATYAAGQWTVAGYALAYALLLITGGRLGDILGRRRVFLAGVAGFTLASAAAGAAVSPGMLIAARVTQGAFAGVMVPQAMSLITARFAPGRDRTAAFSMYGALLGLAQVSGPVLGGLLADHAGPGWRAIFLINIPVGLAALAGAARWMDESRDGAPGPAEPARPRLDLGGVLLISVASLLLTYPLVQGRELGWPLWSVAMLAAAGPALIAFAAYERRRERRRGTPLVPPELFGSRSFTAGLLLTLVLFAGVAACFITLTWGLQFGLGWSPLRMAVTGLAWPAGVACTAQLTHRCGHRRARELVVYGTALMAAGISGLAVRLAAEGHAPGAWSIVPWLFAAGLGLGLTLPILANAVLGDVPPRNAGAASGVFNSVTQLGGAIGVALAGVIFFAGSAPDLTVATPRALIFSAAAFAMAAALAGLLPHRLTPTRAPEVPPAVPPQASPQALGPTPLIEAR